MGKLSRWAFLVFLLLSLLPGRASAAEEGTIKVGITPNPLAVSVSAPDEVIKDRHFTVRAEIQNRGDEKIEKAVATIHLSEEGLSLGKRKAEKRVGTIPPHKVKTVRWRVKAIETGNYIVLVSVSGTGAPGELTAQDSVTVTVEERRRRFFDFFQRWYELFTWWRRG